MSRPYCVALTGGIGSGKSLVADTFARLGAGVVDTDVIARRLTVPGGLAMPSITREFGVEVVAGDGSLDRQRMRELVFSDHSARRHLEGILHPLIREQAAQLVSHSRAPYVILVVPLLVETDAYGELTDRVLVVDCAIERQIERVMGRDGVSEAGAQAMLAAQAERGKRLAAADDVLLNEGTVADLESRIHGLHERYLRLAGADRQEMPLR